MRILNKENFALMAAVLGIAFGILLPDLAKNLTIFGDIFLTLLKLVIVPLVFVSVFLAVARQKSMQNISGLGLKTIIYFSVTSMLACLTGFIASFVLPHAEKKSVAFESFQAGTLKELNVQEIIIGFFSPNFFKSLSDGSIIQIVIVALMLGLAFLQITEKRKVVLLEPMEAINDIIMVFINWILFVAPVGIFSLVASVTAKTDSSLFAGLGWMFAAIAIGLLIHSLITLPALGFFIGKFSPYRFLARIKEPLIVALATASSNATLPVSTRVLTEQENVDPRTAGFMLPLGATVNMDGSSIYQTLIILYLGDLAGIPLTLTHQFYIFCLILVSSVGTAGIPGGGLLMIGAVMQNVGIPLEYLGVYLLIDRVWDPAVTMVNVLGDLFGAKIVDSHDKRMKN
ncbi:MAG TPA: dicarboxylate/amino acid:cation symporter [Bacteriovoracaceae bacterium]|nr:dicarboxylate/amino acid:cation symporter [Bacteriovoracaceae bacterium]